MRTVSQTKPLDKVDLTLARTLYAPRDRVFRAWIDPEQLAKWWGLHNFTNPVCQLDARPGGNIYVLMRGPDGTDFPMSGTFHEIVEPSRLVLSEVAEDKYGNALVEALTTVTFADEGAMTRLTMHTSAAAATAPGAQRLKGVEAGWTQSLERLADFLATMEETAMKAGPQKEHQWLQELVGEWSFEGECIIGPDQPPIRSTGSEIVRSLGGLWTMGEGHVSSPDGTPVTSVMTLGYDPQKKRFVGTFVASTMAHLWTYKGALDATGKVLTLDTRGPRLAADGKMATYQDVIERRSDDHRVLKSRMLGDDGTWREFMTAHYRRTSRQAA